MRKIVFFISFWVVILRGYAQDPIVVSKNFKFADGIYYSFNQLKKNIPDIAWEQVESNLITSTHSLKTQIEYIKLKKTQNNLPLDSVWGVVIEGIPYIKLPQVHQKSNFTIFSGLILRGKICYFQFDDIAMTEVPMTIYIPETGQPYAHRKVIKKEDIVREKLLLFNSGEIIDLSIASLKAQIDDDKDLLQSLNSLKPSEAKEKMFKCLLIYNDRNPVFLSK